MCGVPMTPTEAIADQIGQCLFRLEMNLGGLMRRFEKPPLGEIAEVASLKSDITRDIERLKQAKADLLKL